MENCFYVYKNGPVAGIEDGHYLMPIWMLFYLSRDEHYLMSYLILKTWRSEFYVGLGSDYPLGQSCQMTIETMSREMKSSISAIKRILYSLEKTGLLIKRRCSKGNQYCPDYNLMSDMTFVFKEKDCTPEILIELRDKYPNVDLHKIAGYVKNIGK